MKFNMPYSKCPDLNVLKVSKRFFRHPLGNMEYHINEHIPTNDKMSATEIRELLLV